MDEKKKRTEENPYRINYEDYMDTNACAECTGLIPELVRDEEEWEHYREVYDFFPKAAKAREKMSE